ncbi:MAG TPA: TonB-dependent receptor, partial [Flavisolibacter sp.]|nr:TonB-dependent receptor [Flavisolibacter sp.]
ISKASLRLLNSQRTTITGSDGAFQFPGLAPGRYTLEITAIGYATLVKGVDLSAQTTNFSFQLQPLLKQLEGVTVTAQKQEERLQDIPAAVTAISAKGAAALRLWSAQELTAVVPNLYSGNPGDERNVTSIRGLTTTSFDPAVATYVDGVSQFNLDTYMPQLWNIERVEVLRGPQGTLYGRNALGGVINIITKEPGNKASGFVELNAGNFHQRRVTAGASIPIIKDKLFVGASALYQKRNGYYTNELTGASFDRQQGFTGSYYLKYLPAEKWTLTLNVKHQHNKNGGAFPLVNGVEEAFNNKYRLSQNATTNMIDRTANASVSLLHEGSSFNLTTQAAWQSNYRYYESYLDADFSPLDAVTIYNNFGRPWNRVQVFTHELRLTSPAGRKVPLSWIAGTYLFHQFNPTKISTGFGQDAGALGIPDTDFSTITTSEGKNRGGAIFGQATYTFTNKFSVTAGLRADLERKSLGVMGEYQKGNTSPIVTTPDTSGSARFRALSPKLGISYAASQNNMVYAHYSKGYRAGGLTQLSSDPSQPPLFSFKPEHSHNIELGTKHTALDNRLNFNFTAFLSRVNDVQVPTLILPEAITVTGNSGKLQSVGAELELLLQPAKGLLLQYNGGIVDAEYKSLKVASNGASLDLKGKKQIFTPEGTSFTAVQYTFPVSKKLGISLVGRGEWFHLGRQYFDLANTISQSSYSRFNTRAGIVSPHVELFFWTRNLGNKAYIEYAYDFGGVHLGNPRTLGFTARASF